MLSEVKDTWRMRWLASINELTSIELQRRSWLDRANTNPHWSFVEFFCCYFDDLTLNYNYDEQLKSGLVSEQEFEIIKEWHEALDKYEAPDKNDTDHVAVLNDAKWLEIVQVGVIARTALSLVLNEKERLILNKETEGQTDD
ncbi:MAG: hypothetical protein A2W93_00330 [Bacteroidetes bacterium GWF2_43_63]|nr:MAG: hypothetical protein A2W94_13190 [Bacteroidetes bacterium GWE2_42_42]OFY53852.1 MAG: hypothetical protein A2W93_00330 [Bacteroidetes bacterium GWF2_43_63]HBG69810.1 hypothetical protein [Bacteroidales bacterium]HCB60992.1 hypothetical protein [Bacteroidales bacterium]HCY24548.1 hypothetical protein [Bacteroidales bacterium]